MQRAADLVFVELRALRGVEHAEIAQDLSRERGYSVSRQTVTSDIARLRRKWEALAQETFSASRAKELRKLDALEREAWQGWVESKSAETGANPAFTKQVLEVHDRRVKLLGLCAPTRIESSGPNGSPMQIESSVAPAGPIDEAQKLEVLRRHLARFEVPAVATTQPEETPSATPAV